MWGRVVAALRGAGVRHGCVDSSRIATNTNDSLRYKACVERRSLQHSEHPRQDSMASVTARLCRFRASVRRMASVTSAGGCLGVRKASTASMALRSSLDAMRARDGAVGCGWRPPATRFVRRTATCVHKCAVHTATHPRGVADSLPSDGDTIDLLSGEYGVTVDSGDLLGDVSGVDLLGDPSGGSTGDGATSVLDLTPATAGDGGFDDVIVSDAAAKVRGCGCGCGCGCGILMNSCAVRSACWSFKQNAGATRCYFGSGWTTAAALATPTTTSCPKTRPPTMSWCSPTVAPRLPWTERRCRCSRVQPWTWRCR